MATLLTRTHNIANANANAEANPLDSPYQPPPAVMNDEEDTNASKVAVPNKNARRNKLPDVNALRDRMEELLTELRERGIPVSDPPIDNHQPKDRDDKGSREKRTLTGNTKATKKHMKEAHRKMLAQIITHYESLLEASAAHLPEEMVGSRKKKQNRRRRVH